MNRNDPPLSDCRRLANCDPQRLLNLFATWERRSAEPGFKAKYATPERYALAQLTDSTPAPAVIGYATQPRRTYAECMEILAETAAILRGKAA